MAQTELDWPVSLALFSQKQGQKQRAERSPLCPVFGPCVGAQSRTPALLLSSAQVPGVYHAFWLSLPIGDISTLQNRGHLYFALTPSIP